MSLRSLTMLAALAAAACGSPDRDEGLQPTGDGGVMSAAVCESTFQTCTSSVGVSCRDDFDACIAEGGTNSDCTDAEGICSEEGSVECIASRCIDDACPSDCDRSRCRTGCVRQASMVLRGCWDVCADSEGGRDRCGCWTAYEADQGQCDQAEDPCVVMRGLR